MRLLIPINISIDKINIQEYQYTYRIKYIDNHINTIGIPFQLKNCNIEIDNDHIYLFSDDITKLKYIDNYFQKYIPKYSLIIKNKYNKDCIIFNTNIYTIKFINKKNFNCYIYIKFIKKYKKNTPIIYII